MKKKNAVPDTQTEVHEVDRPAEASGSVPFEEGMSALEQVVERLESGELSLEDALKAFEQGVGLVRMLNNRLTVAEQRVEILSRAENGAVQLRAMEEEES